MSCGIFCSSSSRSSTDATSRPSAKSVVSCSFVEVVCVVIRLSEDTNLFTTEDTVDAEGNRIKNFSSVSPVSSVVERFSMWRAQLV